MIDVWTISLFSSAVQVFTVLVDASTGSVYLSGSIQRTKQQKHPPPWKMSKINGDNSDPKRSLLVSSVASESEKEILWKQV